MWTSVGSCSPPSQVARATVFNCNVPLHVPVDRVRFQVDPKQVNFRRAVAVSDASDHHYGASGEITRVRMNRAGTTVVSEEMDVPIASRFRTTEDHRGQRRQSDLWRSQPCNCCRLSGAYISIRRASLCSGFITATTNFFLRSTTMPGSSKLMRRQLRRSLDPAVKMRRTQVGRMIGHGQSGTKRSCGWQ